MSDLDSVMVGVGRGTLWVWVSSALAPVPPRLSTEVECELVQEGESGEELVSVATAWLITASRLSRTEEITAPHRLNGYGLACPSLAENPAGFGL